MMQMKSVLAALSDEEFAALLSAALKRTDAARVLDGLSPSDKANVQTALTRLAAGEPVDWSEVRAKLMASLV